MAMNKYIEDKSEKILKISFKKMLLQIVFQRILKNYQKVTKNIYLPNNQMSFTFTKKS